MGSTACARGSVSLFGLESAPLLLLMMILALEGIASTMLFDDSFNKLGDCSSERNCRTKKGMRDKQNVRCHRQREDY